MDLSLPAALPAVLLGAVLLLALIRLLSVPLRLARKLLGNTLLGFAALALVRFTAPLTGVSLGWNLFNALFIGVLGLPGFLLLLLAQWVLSG